MPEFPGSDRKLFLGIDTGATKTHILITNPQGNVLAFEEGGPGNPQSIGGFHALERLLTGLVEKSCRSAGITTDQIYAAGLGLAGYDWPSQYDHFFQTIRSAGLPGKSFLVNDAASGIYAGAEKGWGICVAAGTSFNCRGLGPDGREARAIGDGIQWGEGAGGLELAIKSAQLVIADWLRTGLKTALTGLFMEAFGAESVESLVEGMVLHRYPVTAELAPGIIEVAREEDESARQAVNWAAGKLANLAIGAARQLDLQDQSFEVILSGSFFKAGDILTGPMKAKVLEHAPGAEFRLLDIPPVCGAVVLAMLESGEIDNSRLGQIRGYFRNFFK